jgi:DNA-binding FadR family transcriptional regulator
MTPDLPPNLDRSIVSPVRLVSGSEMLADQLRELILSGALAAGAPLASERSLVAQSGLSRATVREAMRILETEGLVDIRAGRSGGARVRRPDQALMSRQLNVFIRGRGLSWDAVSDAREAVEVATAGLAARYRTPADLEAIGQVMAMLEDPAAAPASMVESNIAWHLLVARASQNELLVNFMSSISGAMEDYFHREAISDLQIESSRDVMCKAHRSVFDAIVAGDAEAANRRMARHLRSSREFAAEGPGRERQPRTA